MSSNGDTDREFKVGTAKVRGIGSFHKTLPHSKYGEVDQAEFAKLVDATRGDGSGFAGVKQGDPGKTAAFTNPQGGLASDQLTHHPASYSMPPAPGVLSKSTAAEMTELYWMALLRDVPFDEFDSDPGVADAAGELDKLFKVAVADSGDAGHLRAGIDLPGADGKLAKITPQNLFRLGLPGEDVGPLISQFFLRNAMYGTQTIDARSRPYKKDRNYLTQFDEWLHAQNTGKDQRTPDGQDYGHANEDSGDNFEPKSRLLSTPRDIARFVNKDALHQAYFNAAIIMLSGEARWTTPGNPYTSRLSPREAGFGVLGGPHILALVSEVATRALKVVWNQKWQVHLRLRPEAYGGLAHVQNIGIPGPNGKRPYGLPGLLFSSAAAKKVKKKYGSLLLPMAFTPGSPTHPAYGAGHATVAGACVTVLKAFFQTIETKGGKDVPIAFIYNKASNPNGLKERSEPFRPKDPIKAWVPGVKVSPGMEDEGTLTELAKAVADKLTIEGELNKLAMNVAMGRSIGGVHWRSDNTRSLILGEALAAEILADITTDANEKPSFEFRSFARKADGTPKKVKVDGGRIYVDGVLVDTHGSAL